MISNINNKNKFNNNINKVNNNNTYPLNQKNKKNVNFGYTPIKTFDNETEDNFKKALMRLLRLFTGKNNRTDIKKLQQEAGIVEKQLKTFTDITQGRSTFGPTGSIAFASTTGNMLNIKA